MNFKQSVLNEIFRVGCIIRTPEPNFKLKSGVVSDLYVDLRKLIQHPNILRDTAELINEIMTKRFQFSHVAGIVAGGVSVFLFVHYFVFFFFSFWNRFPSPRWFLKVPTLV